MILWLIACNPPIVPVIPASQVVEQVACDGAGDEGLAVQITRPTTPRYGDVTPVFVDVGGAGETGFQPTADVDQGAVDVQFLDAGTTDGTWASGGTFDEYGPNRLAAVACAVDRAREEGDPVVLIGRSMGGDAALLADVDVDATVLFESPLVDQLVLSEPSPGGLVDPTFVPGSCSLDGGCPFPGRSTDLRFDQGLYRDLDGDGGRGAAEPAYQLAHGPDRPYPSRALLADAGSVLPEAPSLADVDAFWATRDAGPALRDVRDGRRDGRFLFVSTATDHVQVFHEHLRLAEEGLSHASFFRVNPDSAYSGASLETPAGEVIVDPEAEGALPELPDSAMILAASLEMADRAHDGNWTPDLSAPLYAIDVASTP